MEPDRKPEIVDLARYKKAVQAKAKRKAPPPQPAPLNEPILGARPRAGVILVLVVMVFAAFWMISRLH